MGSGDDDATPVPLLSRRLAVPVAVFLSSRLVVLAVAHAARLVEPQALTSVLTRWDGAHYLAIAADGYPSAGPVAGAGQATVHAFFPAYPLLIRAVRDLTGLAPATAAVVANLALATVAMAVIWLLARDLAGEEVATRTVLLLSFAPGAFVLGMAYSEGLFLALAGACLLALHRRWWLVAGLAAAGAGAARPPGVVLALCCAWAALAAIRDGREWKALLAPGLAPLGFLAWSAFLEARTGSFLTWVRSQEEGWDQGFDFGANTARTVGRVLTGPLDSFNATVCVLGIAVAVTGLVLLWRWRPPAVLSIYTAGILFPALFSSVLTSTPRFVMTAFPLQIAFARTLQGTSFALGLALSAAAMALLMAVASVSLLFTP